MLYPTDNACHLTKISSSILQFWKKEKIFFKTLDKNKKKTPFVFFEGPPSANGAPGIHHMLSRTIKDIFCRYKTMQGYYVQRKAGWDTHGLPVELQVEKKLGIKKEDIGKKISIVDYNKHCRQMVLQYQKQWNDLTEKIGYWIDLKNAYMTCDHSYISSVWHLIEQLYKKKWLYKGYTIQPYSPAAGSGLSAHELNQPGCYQSVQDTAIVAQFKIKGTTHDYFLAWTTTPWTLPANSALAVGKNITYVKIKTWHPYTHQLVHVILAAKAIPRYFNPQCQVDTTTNFPQKPTEKASMPWQIVAQYTGATLANESYEQLMPYVQPKKPAFKIILDDFVSTEEGTGIVHIAPTFGMDDYRVAQQNDIPSIMVTNDLQEEVPIVDRQGKFVQEITDFAGRYIKSGYEPIEVRQKSTYRSVDMAIAIKLKKECKAFLIEKYTHNYPHCWRTDQPVLYYPLSAWFIKTTACKKKLIDWNKKINWQPTTTGTGRFGEWLKNLVDWNLSRDRFWGTPLPIWRTKDQKEEKCIGSLQALQAAIKQSVDKGFMQSPAETVINLHRPFIDEVILVSNTGQKMYREKDVVDVWLDAGAMPYAQWGYPEQNKNILQDHFPADFIAEGIDQTRGWFFTLHTLAVMLFDCMAFKNVIAHGLVLDKAGNKMSKRLGNTIDPYQLLDKYGPDTIRWYMIDHANPWENLKFDCQGVEEVKKKFFDTLHHTYNFFALYANIDQFQTTENIYFPQQESDCWILSRLHTTLQNVHTHYEQYAPTQVTRSIQNFVIYDLSNWYVRINRKRFWKSENSQDKMEAYHTLYLCLLYVAKMAAPIAPFYMEKLYRNLTHASKELPISVHLCAFPTIDFKAIDLSLEKKMHWAKTIVSLVHSLRKKYKIKVRQPLAKILIPIQDQNFKTQLKTVENIILAEINVKTIAYIEDATHVVKKKIKPNFPLLGKKYGAKMPWITASIKNMSQTDIQHLEKQHTFDLILQKEKITITYAEVCITSEDIPGWSVATEGDITVALDIQVNEILKKEGLARELVNRIQHIRKKNQLDIQDKIFVQIGKTHTLLDEVIVSFNDYICREVQANVLQVVDHWPLNDTECMLEIEDIKVKYCLGVEKCCKA